jgi:hypothetical protein
MRQRPLSAVPVWLWLVLALALALQVATRNAGAPAVAAEAQLPPPPSAEALRLAAFGESPAAARLAMLYLQSFDYGGANSLPYQKLDYERLVGWLETILALDPRSDYPLFAAARVYAETSDPMRSRRMLDFIYRAFFDDPDRRWPWLAHAALVAKHRLRDLPLALRYAQAVQRHTADARIPAWAKHMEVFILEDMNELEAARLMIAGLLQSGRISDPAELRFLQQRLQELEKLSKPRQR